MKSQEIKALMAVHSVSDHIKKEKLEEMVGKEYIDSLIKKGYISSMKNLKGNWLYVLSIGDIVISRTIKLLELID